MEAAQLRAKGRIETVCAFSLMMEIDIEDEEQSIPINKLLELQVTLEKHIEPWRNISHRVVKLEEASTVLLTGFHLIQLDQLRCARWRSSYSQEAGNGWGHLGHLTGESLHSSTSHFVTFDYSSSYSYIRLRWLLLLFVHRVEHSSAQVAKAAYTALLLSSTDWTTEQAMSGLVWSPRPCHRTSSIGNLVCIRASDVQFRRTVLNYCCTGCRVATLFERSPAQFGLHKHSRPSQQAGKRNKNAHN